MAESAYREQAGERAAAASAMLLLQLAASQAEIGPFARRGRETPQMAAGLYRAAALRARTGLSRHG
ncbi:MAG: hypothetical protein K2X91_03535 [Thermoleophilia bacterium]|uniref:hypothetical protein n=1 Tax=Bosea sp. (in: a-proteobacteria) TaxID=1871050 RepID=UPI002B480FC3|nr:hypothetical protein [Bosea sp. (in: a-proteobacteria)]MBY0395529.1 hypothetical protein [Thermoleophilia bacterium]WRH56064.1 MAG: hypothetical protein RSE11_13470 [Bosea sp. (in: a-proteobacteria)]